MSGIIEQIQVLSVRLSDLGNFLNLAGKQERIKEIETWFVAQEIYSHSEEVILIQKELARLQKEVAEFELLNQEVKTIREVAEEDNLLPEVSLGSELEKQLSKVAEKLEQLEFKKLLAGPYDGAPAIMTIFAGAGGVDAQDWTEMLTRMYLRFTEQMGFSVSVLNESRGTEAGLKSITLEVVGDYAYGYLKEEHGVHRLVRLSPYDADHARHTSFAMVEVVPELEKVDNLEIKEDDLRIDVYRSSGHGGQSVNTTDSAVRLTHIPTGITTQCQNERSQKQNKEKALSYLKGKLAKYYAAKQEEERQMLRGELTSASWGNQIRSYVLHPYQMVKDHRTELETKEPQKVLDGDLLPFIEARLKQIK